MGISLFVCFKADILSSFPMYLYIPEAIKHVINVNYFTKFLSIVKFVTTLYYKSDEGHILSVV